MAELKQYGDNPKSIGPGPIACLWLGMLFLPAWIAGMIWGGSRAANENCSATWGNFWFHLLMPIGVCFAIGVIIGLAEAGI